IGLDLPEHLTDKEIRRIGCASAAPLVKDSPWYIGDFMLWLKAHPDAPLHEWMKAKFFEAGRFTQRTFDNYMSVCRTFPLKARVKGLSFRHHDARRAEWIPEAVKREWFNRALPENENLSPTDLGRLREEYAEAHPEIIRKGRRKTQHAAALRDSETPVT